MREYLKIMIGTFWMAAATNMVFQPLGIVTGGFSGIGILLFEICKVPLWITNVLFNVPLFFTAYRLHNRKFFHQMLFGALTLSVFLGMVPTYNFLSDDFYVNLILGTVMMGVGLGVILRDGNSTGGTDLMAVLLTKKYSKISVPVLLGMIDGLIVAAGMFVFGIEHAAYALICIFGITKIADSFCNNI